MKKWFFLVAGVMSLVCIPQAAQAAPGYMTCQGFQADNRRVIYTRAFAAESASADAMYEQFLKSLEGSYITNISQFSGICNWEASRLVAERKGGNYKEHFVSAGANSIEVPYEGFVSSLVATRMPAATVPTASPAALAKTRAAIDRKQLYGWCNLTDVKNRKVYFSELFTYTGERQDADAMGRAFMVDLKKLFGKKIVGDPLCSSTYSEEDERTERQQSLDMYTDITTVNYLRWKPVSN